MMLPPFLSQSVVWLDAGCVAQPATATVRVVDEAEATHLSLHLRIWPGPEVEVRQHLSPGHPLDQTVFTQLLATKAGLVENPLPAQGWLWKLWQPWLHCLREKEEREE